jgi:hypothetical protein
VIVVLQSCSTKYAKDVLQGWFSEDKPASLETHRLSLFEYEDKLMGAWAGKMIGVGFAQGQDFQAKGTMLEVDLLAAWQPSAWKPRSKEAISTCR